MKGKILKKVLAAALVLTLVTGGMPIAPVSDMFGGVGIVANAEAAQEQIITYTIEREATGGRYIYYLVGSDGTSNILIDSKDASPTRVTIDMGDDVTFDVYLGGASINCGDTQNQEVADLVGFTNYFNSSSNLYEFTFTSKTHKITHVQIDGRGKNNYKEAKTSIEADGNEKTITVQWACGSGGTRNGVPGKFIVTYAPPVSTYNISYELNGGTNASSNPATYDDDKGATLSNPTRTHYSFGGWYDNEGFSGDPITAIPVGSTGDVTLYAKWTINSYTVTWKNYDGTVLETDTKVSLGATPTYNGVTPTKANDDKYSYTFKEWSPAISSVTGDVTYTATYTKAPLAAHFSQDGDVYTIHDATGWDVFCELLADNDNGYFTGKTVNLVNDISVNRQAGISNHDFTGTFEGNGKTLTFNYTGSKDYIAPFYATANNSSPYFRNLTVNGTINSTGVYAAGLIGHLYGNVTIENCKSEIDITSAGNSGGFVGLCEHTVNFTNCLSSTVIHSEGTCNSGFVGWSRASGYEINFTGCLFNGKLLQKNGSGGSNGGFIGWTGSNKTVTINNSVCAPAALSSGETMASGNSATFARGWNSTTTASNSYYITAFGTAQAKAAHSVTAGSNVTLALSGTEMTYNVSGITSYENNSGLKYGDTIYAGNGDSVSLTLGHNTPTGYSTAYTASAGTLVNGVLTMPDSDVVINANDTQNDYTITKSTEHGTMIVTVGETQNATTAHYNDTVTLTVTPDAGYIVKSVTVNGTAAAKIDDTHYSFTMPAGDVTVSAEFEMIKTEVIINSVDINGISTPTTVYAETYTSADYTVPASPYLDGYTFSGWKVNNGETLSTPEDVQSAVPALVAAKPETPITVAVVYTKKEDTHTVNVDVGGAFSDGSKEKTFHVSDIVTVIADQQSAEQQFAYWKRGDQIVSYDRTYSFFMPDKDIQLTAIYKTGVEQQGIAFIEKVDSDKENGKMIFVSVCNVPERCKMKSAGLIADLNKDNLSAFNTARFKKLSGKVTENTKNLKYTWTVSGANDNTVLYVRSYLVYEDADGETHELLGDVVKASLDSWTIIKNEVTE